MAQWMPNVMHCLCLADICTQDLPKHYKYTQHIKMGLGMRKHVRCLCLRAYLQAQGSKVKGWLIGQLVEVCTAVLPQQKQAFKCNDLWHLLFPLYPCNHCAPVYTNHVYSSLTAYLTGDLQGTNTYGDIHTEIYTYSLINISESLNPSFESTNKSYQETNIHMYFILAIWYIFLWVCKNNLLERIYIAFIFIIRTKLLAHALALQNLKQSLSTQTQHSNRKTSSLSALSHALQETEGSCFRH